MSGLSWAQLGLGRDRIRCGAVCAAGAIAAVGVVYLVGVLQPATRLAFLGARCHLDVAGALLSALVVIPVGTVLLEEVAFPVRGLTHLGLVFGWVFLVVSLTPSLLPRSWPMQGSCRVAPSRRAMGSVWSWRGRARGSAFLGRAMNSSSECGAVLHLALGRRPTSAS